MEWMDKMNCALDYIEANLDDEIDYDKISKLAGCSKYHFQRMFLYITGVSLSEYIRRRRLTLAAFELQKTDLKIIDIALKYGYESPDSFTRAFYRLHGINPSIARRNETCLKAYSKISFYITLKGEEEMEYRIIEREEINVFGVVVNGNEQDRRNLKTFLNECHNNGKYEEIRLMAKYGSRKLPGEKQLFQIVYDFNSDGNFKYMLAAEVPDDRFNVSGYEILTIPSATYAVFTDRCPINEPVSVKASDIWQRLPEWFQSVGYEHADKPMLEIPSYTEREKIIEIMIPIEKKKRSIQE